MILNPEKIEKTVLKNFKGGEKETIASMYTDENNKILFGSLCPGASIGMHTHETGSEAIYITKGRGMLLYDDGTEEVYEGVCHYCPMGHSHSLINNSDEELHFFAVVPEHKQ